MLDSVRALADALARDDASADDLVTRLDGRATDHGPNVIVDEPTLHGVSRGNVVRRRPGEDVPAHVVLQLREPLELEPLAALLGEPTKVHPDHPGAATRLVYRKPLVDGPHPITVIAESAARGPALSIVLRRD